MIPGLGPGAGKRLQAVWEALSAPERDALLPHLNGSTSAEWIANTLTAAGHAIGATSIKSYKRSLREAGERV